MKLTSRQQAILVGTILGDGYLQKTGERNARLRLEHGEKQRDYLLWKAAQFPRLFQGTSTMLARVHPISKETYHYCRHQSSTSPELGKWRARFYPEGKKMIPKDIGLLMNPLSLAVWYMDDGYYLEKEDTSDLYLGRVSAAEAEYARSALETVLGISPRVYDKKKKGFVLYFPKEATHRLHRMVRPYMHPLFAYKLSAHL